MGLFSGLSASKTTEPVKPQQLEPPDPYDLSQFTPQQWGELYQRPEIQAMKAKFFPTEDRWDHPEIDNAVTNAAIQQLREKMTKGVGEMDALRQFGLKQSSADEGEEEWQPDMAWSLNLLDQALHPMEGFNYAPVANAVASAGSRVGQAAQNMYHRHQGTLSRQQPWKAPFHEAGTESRFKKVNLPGLLAGIGAAFDAPDGESRLLHGASAAAGNIAGRGVGKAVGERAGHGLGQLAQLLMRSDAFRARAPGFVQTGLMMAPAIGTGVGGLFGDVIGGTGGIIAGQLGAHKLSDKSKKKAKNDGEKKAFEDFGLDKEAFVTALPGLAARAMPLLGRGLNAAKGFMASRGAKRLGREVATQGAIGLGMSAMMPSPKPPMPDGGFAA